MIGTTSIFTTYIGGPSRREAEAFQIARSYSVSFLLYAHS